MVVVYLLLFYDANSPLRPRPEFKPPVISPPKSAFEIIHAQGLYPEFYGILTQNHNISVDDLAILLK